MKKSPQPLDETLRLSAVEDGDFSGVILPTWSQGRACFGGICCALCSRATRLLVSPERRLLSINITYVGRSLPAPSRVRCERLERGSSVSHLECRVLQDGKPRVVLVNVSYGTRRLGSLDMPRIELPNWAGEPGAGLELPFIPHFHRSSPNTWTIAGKLPTCRWAEPRPLVFVGGFAQRCRRPLMRLKSL